MHRSVRWLSSVLLDLCYMFDSHSISHSSTIFVWKDELSVVTDWMSHTYRCESFTDIPTLKSNTPVRLPRSKDWSVLWNPSNKWDSDTKVFGVRLLVVERSTGLFFPQNTSLYKPFMINLFKFIQRNNFLKSFGKLYSTDNHPGPLPPCLPTFYILS